MKCKLRKLFVIVSLCCALGTAAFAEADIEAELEAKANALQNMGRYNEALEVWQNLIQHHMSRAPEDYDGSEAWLFFHFADLNFAAGHLDTAYRIADALIDDLNSADDKDYDLLLRAFLIKADVKNTSGLDARKDYEWIIETGKKFLGSEHKRTLEGMIGLAYAYSNFGMYSHASKILEEVLPKSLKVFSEKSNPVLNIRILLAECYKQMKKYSEARNIIQEHLNLCRELTDGNSAITLKALSELASVNIELGLDENAQQILDGLIAAAEHALSDDDWAKFDIFRNAADAYGRSGQYRKAIDILHIVSEKLGMIFGKNNIDRLKAMSKISDYVKALDDYPSLSLLFGSSRFVLLSTLSSTFPFGATFHSRLLIWAIFFLLQIFFLLLLLYLSVN